MDCLEYLKSPICMQIQNSLCILSDRDNQTVVQQRKNHIRKLLIEYRNETISEENKSFLESAVKRYGEFLHHVGSDADKRRYRSLMLVYMSRGFGLKYTALYATVGGYQHINKRTVLKDLSHAINGLTVFLFGIDGVEFS